VVTALGARYRPRSGLRLGGLLLVVRVT
jgi:hypothetical protein